MRSLYQVTLERTSYGGKNKTTETVELFADSPKSINTYRLGGFQQDSIKIIKTKKIRSRHTIEVDCDIERNELSFSVSVDDHLSSTLKYSKKLTDKIGDDEEALIEMGYVERAHDNTYNYSSDFENDIMFKVFDLNKESDYIYSENVVVMVYEHTGLDARAGYKFKGIYRPLEQDGICYFFDMHVRLSVDSLDGSENIDDFDGDGAAYNLLKQYKIKSFNEKTQEVILTKNGTDYRLSYYHPAEGV